MPKINPTRTPSNFQRCSITPGEAHVVYVQMKRPTMKKLTEHLKAQGHRVSLATLIKWSQKYRWHESHAISERRHENEIIKVLETMSVEGLAFKSENVTGLQARLIVKLGDALPKLEIKTPADVVLLIEACERLRGLSHTVRGDAFAGVTKTAESLVNAPNVTLGSFKPKVVAASNGAAKPNGNGEAHE